MHLASNIAYRVEKSPTGHALDAYVCYVNSLNNNNSKVWLKAARRFIRTYPDLAKWQELSLVERIGSTHPRRGYGYIGVIVRPYLYFLVQQECIVLDWPWIIGVQTHVLPINRLPQAVQEFSSKLVEKIRLLGYKETAFAKVERAVRYFFIRHGNAIVNVGELELDEFAKALEDFQKHDDAVTIFGTAERLQRCIREFKSMLFTFKTALYQNYCTPKAPKRTACQPIKLQVKPAMRQFIEKYAESRSALHTRPTTIAKIGHHAKHLADWLLKYHPAVESFAELTRELVLSYAAYLVSTGVNLETQLSRLSSISVMFHDTTAWGWPDAPQNH